MPLQKGTYINFDIQHPPGVSAHIPSFSELRFNPVGIFNLRRRLECFQTEPHLLVEYKRHFRASDIAWLAAGMSTDGNHAMQPGMFHPAFSTCFNPVNPVGDKYLEHMAWAKNLRGNIRELIFDLVG